jgi:hypothetical protein
MTAVARIVLRNVYLDVSELEPPPAGSIAEMLENIGLVRGGIGDVRRSALAKLAAARSDIRDAEANAEMAATAAAMLSAVLGD